MTQQPAVASSQSEEDGLLVPLQLVGGISATADIELAFLLGVGAVSFVKDSFGSKFL